MKRVLTGILLSLLVVSNSWSFGLWDSGEYGDTTGTIAAVYFPLTADLLVGHGTGTITYGRASVQNVADHEGIYRPVVAGYPAFPGARQITNLMTYSEDFSNAVWTKNAVTRTTESVAGPYGGTVTATKLTGDGTSAGHYLGGQNILNKNGSTVAAGALIKKGTSRYAEIVLTTSRTLVIFDFDTGRFVDPITTANIEFWSQKLDNGWYWIYAQAGISQASEAFRVYLIDGTLATTNTSTESIYILAMQAVDVSAYDAGETNGYRTKNEPLEYVATTSVPVTASFNTVPVQLQNISFFGDSLTSGLPDRMAPKIPTRYIHAYNEGGYTSAQILSTVTANPTRLNDIVVIWAGSNDNVSDPFDVNLGRNNIAAMVAALGSNTRFMIMGALPSNNSEFWSPGTRFDRITAYNSWIAATYPDNYFDILAYLRSQSTHAGQDAIDDGHGIHPDSLRADAIHLNATGQNLVYLQIYNFIKNKGWLDDPYQYTTIQTNGILMEPTGVNFTTAYGLNDPSAAGSAPTGMTKTGNATATLKVANSTALTAKLRGMAPGANSGSAFRVYTIDNTLGGTGDAIVTVAGSSATSPQSYSIYAQADTGSGTLQNDSGEGAVVFTNSTPARIISENVTVAGARQLQIVVPLGSKVTFCLQQAEVGPKATSFMISAGATASRSATTATLPIPTGAKRITVETGTGVDSRLASDYTTTIKVGAPDTGVYAAPTTIKNLRVFK